MTLTEFLLARIAEREVEARHSLAGDLEYLPSLTTKHGDVIYLGVTHPARVLAECEAMRRLVAAHEVNCIGVHTWPFTDLEIRADRAGVDVGLWAAIQFSALPYVHHPDYLPEWKP